MRLPMILLTAFTPFLAVFGGIAFAVGVSQHNEAEAADRIAFTRPGAECGDSQLRLDAEAAVGAVNWLVNRARR